MTLSCPANVGLDEKYFFNFICTYPMFGFDFINEPIFPNSHRQVLFQPGAVWYIFSERRDHRLSFVTD